MSDTDVVGKGRVSGNQVSIPAHVRRRFGIEDGDVLRWRIQDDELWVEIVHQGEGAFDDFHPGESEGEVDSVAEHDGFGIE